MDDSSALHSRVMRYQALAHKCAYRVRRAWIDHDDLVQEGLMALFIAFQKCEARGTVMEAEPAFAATVMRRAMFRYLTHQSGIEAEEPLPPEGLLSLVGFVGEDEFFARVFIDEYLDEVQRLLGPTAHQIARELVFPGPTTSTVAMGEKQAIEFGVVCCRTGEVGRAECQTITVVCVQTGRAIRTKNKHNTKAVGGRHVQSALGLSSATWHRELGKLRSFTREWLDSQREAC